MNTIHPVTIAIGCMTSDYPSCIQLSSKTPAVTILPDRNHRSD
ncbi:MAG TPA: hypothetical protein VM802_00965 [Chitinophaga sp.]|nr:hypothetical protein [Chitinophaga sp.]HVI43402.1 hypothetical protein [Chitinophaga sp.]